MKLSDLSIRRPVLASMLSVALVLFGVIGYRQLSVREFPDVDPPIISVRPCSPGANPQVMESAVTDILEEELSTVQGLRTLTSSSAEQFSNITLEFNLDRDVDDAAQDVRDKVSRVRGRLPRGHRGAGHRQAGGRRQPFFWLALIGRELRPAAAVRHRPTGWSRAGCRAFPGSAAPDLRRAALLDAGLALDGAAGGARPHRAGRRARHPNPQRRGAGRPDRVGPPRVHRPVAGRAQDAGRSSATWSWRARADSWSS